MNSLFQDPQLLQQFSEILKQGQAQPANVQDLAKKLINNLSRTMEGSVSEITSGAGKADASLAHFSSLSSLLKFLTDSKIAVDGKRIAYTDVEFATLPDEEKRIAGENITGETIQEVDNRPVGTDYWVNTKALADYLQHLQARGTKDEETGNVQRGKLLQAVTGNLLKKIQNTNIGAEVSAEPKPTSPAPLPENTPVDAFTTKSFDEAQPLADSPPLEDEKGGTFVLQLQHLKSHAALDNWLQQGGGRTSYVVVHDAKGKHAIEYGTEGADPCPIMRVFFLRARDKQNKASGDPAKKRIADAYLQAVQNVGAQFTGLDGKPCHILLPETVPSEVASTETKEVHPEAAITKDQQLSITHAIETLPFEEARINFARFNTFFEQVSKLPLPAEAQTNLQQAREAMATATKLSGQTIFDLDEPVEQYAHTLKDPDTGQPTQSWGIHLALMIHALLSLVFFTRKIIEAFWFLYGQRYPGDQRKFQNAERKVLAQIGRSATDYSLYQQNFLALQRKMPTRK